MQRTKWPFSTSCKLGLISWASLGKKGILFENLQIFSVNCVIGGTIPSITYSFFPLFPFVGIACNKERV